MSLPCGLERNHPQSYAPLLRDLFQEPDLVMHHAGPPTVRRSTASSSKTRRREGPGQPGPWRPAPRQRTPQLLARPQPAGLARRPDRTRVTLGLQQAGNTLRLVNLMLRASPPSRARF